jgi:hypothetical protein
VGDHHFKDVEDLELFYNILGEKYQKEPSSDQTQPTVRGGDGERRLQSQE